MGTFSKRHRLIIVFENFVEFIVMGVHRYNFVSPVLA